MVASWFQSIPTNTKVWGLRILLVVSIVFLCSLSDSPLPALALTVSWSPNGLFVAAYVRGQLHLPQFLERVHPIEPVIYRHMGVGVAKRIVETRMWPLMCGNELPPKFRTRTESLDFTEQAARAAEVCHAATFALASLILLVCLATGNRSAALWILVFNFALNGYPMMLQRSHRWRIQHLRARTRPESFVKDSDSGYSKSIQVPPNKSLERTRDG
jgi:hypothetical protein